MLTPRISVIVSIYNAEKFLHRCIDSILAQSFVDFELLLIDDGSIDNSSTICDEYAIKDKRVHVIHKVNGGVSTSRNSGLDNAKGEWIIFCDSDDYWELSMLERMFNVAIANDADCVYCDFNFIKQSGKQRYFSPQATIDKKETINNWVNTKWTVIWNILAKRSTYVENGLKFPKGIRYCEDFYVGIQLLCFSTKIVHVAEPLYNYNMLNQTSVLHTDSLNQMNNDSAKVYDMILDILAKENLFGLCGKSVSWRFLDGMQHCVLDKLYFEKFKTLHPETHKYIMSCPYLNKKIRGLMWCLDKNLDVIVSGFIWIRHLLKS